jgi:hypothetical protein
MRAGRTRFDGSTTQKVASGAKGTAQDLAAAASVEMESSQSGGKEGDKARLAGKLYFHGMPDRLGHTKRLVSSTACVICGNRSFKRMSPKRKAQVLKTNRERDRRATLALKVLERLGIEIVL